MGEEEEEDVAGKILGAVAIGLGNTIGIRACMLREGETRLRQRSDTHSSGEDEVCVVLYMIWRYCWGRGCRVDYGGRLVYYVLVPTNGSVRAWYYGIWLLIAGFLAHLKGEFSCAMLHLKK